MKWLNFSVALSRMKIYVPGSRNQPSRSAYQRVFSHFFCSNSTTSQYVSSDDNLYRRISPLGDPKISVVPVLDQWVREGKSVRKKELQKIIRELKVYCRFKHALEVSQWMTEKKYFPLAAADVAMRMNLIFKIDGLKAVENYYSGLTEKLKVFQVDVSLLNCYANEKSVQKAEAIMHKLRTTGCIRSPLAYNIMMNLYYSLGNWKKLDDLMDEMQGKGITYDCFTYSIRLSAYAAASDVAGVDEIVYKMESDAHITMDCSTYSTIAQAYLKLGHLDKVLTVLVKMEGLATRTRTRNFSFEILIKMYAEIGRKDDVYRIWRMYTEDRKIYNRGYVSMMSSLSKFNDVEGIEKIFEEWESSGLPYDFRVPNTLLKSYCRNGQVQKAENLVTKASLQGGKPFSTTWYYLAEAYIKHDRVAEAIKALKKAVLAWQPNDWPSKETLSTIVEYLETVEEEEDVVKEEEFLRLLKNENIFSGTDHERMVQFVKRKQKIDC